LVKTITLFGYLVVRPITISRKPESEERCVLGFKKNVKGYKICDPKDKKISLNRDVTFDESSVVKPTDSQQVENEKSNMISQQVESGVTSPSPNSSVSFKIIPEVTQNDIM